MKEKQGARIITHVPVKTVSGETTKVVWLLPREDWLARHPDVTAAPLARPDKHAPFPERLRMPATPVLESERLVLRPLRQGDAPAIQRGFDDWEVVKHLNAKVPWPYPADGAATHLREALAEIAARTKCLWAITLKGGDDELIGVIDLWADDGLTRTQRGFWLARPYWGSGLMTEAAERVTEFAFAEIGWPHLWLSNAEANRGSHRVKVKQGAREIARIPSVYVSGPGDRVIWLLTREDWLARRG